MRFYHSPLGLFLAACCIAFTQALCKLSELDSSELTKEYKDPTDAYVIGDIIRGTYHNYVPHILIKIWTLFNLSDTKFLMAYIFFSCRSNYKCKWWGGKSVNLFEKFKITWCT